MSGRALGYPHYIACALSSEPKLQAIRAVVLKPDLGVGKIVAKRLIKGVIFSIPPPRGFGVKSMD